MARSIKFSDDTFLDASGVSIRNGLTLNSVIQRVAISQNSPYERAVNLYCPIILGGILQGYGVVCLLITLNSDQTVNVRDLMTGTTFTNLRLQVSYAQSRIRIETPLSSNASDFTLIFLLG